VVLSQSSMQGDPHGISDVAAQMVADKPNLSRVVVFNRRRRRAAVSSQAAAAVGCQSGYLTQSPERLRRRCGVIVVRVRDGAVRRLPTMAPGSRCALRHIGGAPMWPGSSGSACRMLARAYVDFAGCCSLLVVRSLAMLTPPTCS